VLAATLASACSGLGSPVAVRPLSTLRAEAILTSERPVNGHEKVFRGPLTGYSVAAVATDGNRAVAQIDHSGLAVLHLPAGRYVVTTSEKDACPPAKVTLAPAEVLTVNLHCVAP
jgi:hypothetical protein